MKLHEILPGRLYQRGLTRDVREASCFAACEERGIEVVACVVAAPDLRLKSWLERRGGEYIFLPFADGNHVPALAVALGDYLAQQVLRGRPTLIHCRAGRNRSGFVSALVVRSVLGVDGREALQHVQLARPNAIANEAFAEYLRRLPAP